MKQIINKLNDPRYYLSEEYILNHPTKKYSSGREMKAGDCILFGFLECYVLNVNEKYWNLISFHIDELEDTYWIFETQKYSSESTLLRLKKII